jgi:hypothetical protein
MINDPHDPVTDQNIEQDFEAVSAAWRDLEREQPPDMLDQAVLNSARRALEQRGKPRPFRWLGGLATAAVVVLAVAIVVHQERQGPVAPPPKTDGFGLERSVAEPARDARAREEVRDKAVAVEARKKQVGTAAQALASDSPQLLREQRAPAPSAALEEDAAPSPPEAWIERLQELKRAGRIEEMRAELAAFRQAYPDYPLPPELLD